jgi:hypothetical protein
MGGFFCCIKDPNETKRVIEGIIACLDVKGKYFKGA